MNELKPNSNGDQTVTVRLVGVLAAAAGHREVELQVEGDASVSDVVVGLLKRFNDRQFRDFLVDPSTGDPRTSVIILLDDRDQNLFDGLKTKLERGTVVTIIPVAHGG